VLRLVAEGKTSKDIAVLLDLGLQTVRSYRKTMMKKLGVNNVARPHPARARRRPGSLEHQRRQPRHLKSVGQVPACQPPRFSTARLAQPEVAMVADAPGARSPQQKKIQVAQRK